MSIFDEVHGLIWGARIPANSTNSPPSWDDSIGVAAVTTRGSVILIKSGHTNEVLARVKAARTQVEQSSDPESALKQLWQRDDPIERVVAAMLRAGETPALRGMGAYYHDHGERKILLAFADYNTDIGAARALIEHDEPLPDVPFAELPTAL